MRYPDLPQGKRLVAAELSGEIQRLAWGRDSELEITEKLDQIWALTRDPQILGHLMGPYLAEEHPSAGGKCAAILLWVAGADRQTAEANADWQRYRRVRELGGGPRT